MKSVTIIIPLVSMTTEKLKKLYSVIGSISKTQISTIIVDSPQSLNVINVKDFPNISYVVCEDSQTNDESALVNYAALKCDSQFIWKISSDFICNWVGILESLKDSPYTIIRKNRDSSTYIVNREIYLKETAAHNKLAGFNWENSNFVKYILDKYDVDISSDSHIIQIKPTNFIHITSYYIAGNAHDVRQHIARASLLNNNEPNRILINLVTSHKNDAVGFTNILVEDQKPFLDDIIRIGVEHSLHDDDVIVYTNSDCYIDNKFYDNLKNSSNVPSFLYRRDIYKQVETTCIEDVINSDHIIHTAGIDGVSLTRNQCLKFKQFIPHMKIAEPLWDNMIYGIFNYNKIQVNNLYGILYHVDHNRSWQASDVCHNSLYRSSDDNKKYFALISPPTQSAPLISVVCCSYAPVFNRNVIESQIHFIKNLRYQNIPHELIFVELGFDDKFYFSNIQDMGMEVGNPNYKHIAINGKEENKFIFHKESLWNIGKKHASTNTFLFSDADIVCEDVGWLSSIHTALTINKNIVYQPFRVAEDTKDSNIRYVSAAARIRNDYSFDKRNPGLCWAMSRESFEDFGGFNNLCIFGDGDTCLLEEIVDHSLIPPEKQVSNMCSRIYVSLHAKRDIKSKKIVDYLDFNLKHMYHGSIDIRKYYERNYIFFYIKEKLKKSIRDYVDNSGEVVKWKNLENEALWMIREKVNIPALEEDAMKFFSNVIENNISRLHICSRKIIDIPFMSNVSQFRFFNGKNLKAKSGYLPATKIDGKKYVVIEADNKDEISQVNIFWNNWNKLDITNYKNIFITFKSDNECFFSVAGKEKPLVNGYNDISSVVGNYDYFTIKFKNSISIDKLYLDFIKI